MATLATTDEQSQVFVATMEHLRDKRTRYSEHQVHEAPSGHCNTSDLLKEDSVSSCLEQIRTVKYENHAIVPETGRAHARSNG